MLSFCNRLLACLSEAPSIEGGWCWGRVVCRTWTTRKEPPWTRSFWHRLKSYNRETSRLHTGYLRYRSTWVSRRACCCRCYCYTLVATTSFIYGESVIATVSNTMIAVSRDTEPETPTWYEQELTLSSSSPFLLLSFAGIKGLTGLIADNAPKAISHIEIKYVFLSYLSSRAIADWQLYRALFSRKIAIDASSTRLAIKYGVLFEIVWHFRTVSMYQFLIAVRQQDGQQLQTESGETTSWGGLQSMFTRSSDLMISSNMILFAEWPENT